MRYIFNCWTKNMCKIRVNILVGFIYNWERILCFMFHKGRVKKLKMLALDQKGGGLMKNKLLLYFYYLC